MASASLQSGEISQLIRLKERELHEIHDLRCSQLEKLVAERDSLLLEAGRRFEQLRDDFQYNLALLEARDGEIRRLEGIVEGDNKRIGALESEKRSLTERIESFSLKDHEREAQIQEEKTSNKVAMFLFKNCMFFTFILDLCCVDKATCIARRNRAIRLGCI